MAGSSASGVVRIRPRHLFALLPAPTVASPTFHAVFPVLEGGRGGLTMVEQAVLSCLVRLSGGDVFEFGTYLGSSTLAMALNSGEGARVVTLDIPDAGLAVASPAGGVSTEDDSRLRRISQPRSGAYLDFAPPHVQAKVTRLRQDSTTLDVEGQKLARAFDLIFVDGGHDERTVRSDTENALKLMRDPERSWIVWHDYASPIHGDVKGYVDSFAAGRSVWHVGDTMLAVYSPHLAARLVID